jgi:hypothetical protein
MIRCALLVIVALLTAGCGASTGQSGYSLSPTTNVDVATSSAESRNASAASSPRLTRATLDEEPPANCPITKPAKRFVPPPPAPARPPGYYHADWYGSQALWTMLNRDGEVWAGLPHDSDGFGQKTFWWSTRWDPYVEPQPAITVSGRELGGLRRFDTSGMGTNAQADFGAAMLIGIGIPAAGCWRLTGTYRDENLSYVVWVPG